jgi:hypothetical protein
LLLAMGRTQSNAVKLCRADAQRFAQENASYEVEYDALYGATTLAQRPMSELLDRNKELMGCIEADPSHRGNTRPCSIGTALSRAIGFLPTCLTTKRLQDFAKWEREQRAFQLAKYSEKSEMGGNRGSAD